MSNAEQHLEHLAEMRSLMERSTRFLSLSGLSGVWAGLCALFGAAYHRMVTEAEYLNQYADILVEKSEKASRDGFEVALISTALTVLIAALAGGWFFTARKARQRGERVWDASSRRLLWALALPLITGGIFCLALLYWRLVGLLAPATLVFYGLALFNGSKYTLRDVGSLGLLEIALGLSGMFVPGYGLELWAIGFGVLHILYGAWMYVKYDGGLLDLRRWTCARGN
ncbi:MAG: hypothetical protein J0M29_12800 [Chitinophagales bacterium]|nr:hypothetical protein [Chitinophagales bacterium]